MEEIQVGEYVRTKDGRIIKFNKFGTLRVGCTNPKYYKTIISNRSHYKYDNIVKHSSNIIDLIEVGDIVNYTFWKEPDDFTIFCEMIRDIDQLLDFKFDIEENNITLNSILTKEQFKENCYKVGD